MEDPRKWSVWCERRMIGEEEEEDVRRAVLNL